MKKITQITKYSFVAILLLAFTSNSVFAFSSYDYSYGGDDISSYDYNYGGDSVSSYDYYYGGDDISSYDYNYGGDSVSSYGYYYGGDDVSSYDYYYGGDDISSYDYNYGGDSVSSYDYYYGGDDVSSYDYNYGGDSVSSYDYNYGGDSVSSYDYYYGGDDISSYDYNYGGDSVSSYDYNYGGDYVASYYYDGYDGYNDYYTDDDYYYDNDCYDCGSNYYPTPNYVYTPSTYVYTNNNGGCTNCGGSNPPRQDRLDVRCEVSDSTVEEGERVEFTVDVDGGDSPFDYEWSGDVDGDDRTISERFNREGRYTARITVTDDDGNRASDTCSVRVEEEDRDGSISVTSTTGLSNPNLGNPAVSSVYLSQVPYTGAGDTLMFMLWSIVGLLLTIGIVSKARKASYRKQVETRVEQFKEANRTIA